MLLTKLFYLQGPAQTAYEGLTYRLLLTFTSEYPFKPPAVKFDTPCFHPNVDVHGNICLDILKEKWSGEHSKRATFFSAFFFTVPPMPATPPNTRPSSTSENVAAAYSVGTVLQSIQSLLGDANVDSPLNIHAAKLWGTNNEEYRELVLKAHEGKK